jgi:hypothetical protein
MEVCTFNGFWTLEDVRDYSEYLFIFGDNDVRKGKNGQAIIRDEPNAAGIPTKKFPSFAPSSFYTDKDYEKNIIKIDKAIQKILLRIKNEGYKGIILPKDGLGTGLSKLNVCAPRTFEYLNKRIYEFYFIK